MCIILFQFVHDSLAKCQENNNNNKKIILFLHFFRNAVMFNNEHMADVHFIVGPPGATQKVPAHKVSLTSSSFNHNI